MTAVDPPLRVMARGQARARTRAGHPSHAEESAAAMLPRARSSAGDACMSAEASRTRFGSQLGAHSFHFFAITCASVAVWRRLEGFKSRHCHAQGCGAGHRTTKRALEWDGVAERRVERRGGLWSSGGMEERMIRPSDAELMQWVETSRYRKRKEFESLHGFFTVIERLGEGTFSEVFKAVRHQDKMLVAIKQLNRTTKAKQVYNESFLLQKLKGEENVAHLLGGHAGQGAHTHVQHTLIFPLYEHDDFRDLLNNVDIEDVKRYMYALCNALANIHKHNIIHRDVKPSNFLFSKAAGTGYLIDFGLAHEWRQSKNNPRPNAYQQEGQQAQVWDTAPLHQSVHVKENVDNQVETHRGLLRSMGEKHVRGTRDATVDAPAKQEGVEPTRVVDQHLDHGSETSPTSGRRSSTCPEERKPLCDLLLLMRRKRNSHTMEGQAWKRDSLEQIANGEAKAEIPGNAPGLSRGEPSLVKPGTPSRGPSAAGPRPLTSGRSRALRDASKVDVNGNGGYPIKAQQEANKRLPMKLPGKPHRSRRAGARTPDANRGGTPGFRAPEVLLRETQQGPGIDVWSAGVTFASLLTGRYPLFSGGSDDCGALLELCVLFGARRVEDVAFSLRKRTTLLKLFRENPRDLEGTAADRPAVERETGQLRDTLLKLNSDGGRVLKNKDIPALAFDLLEKLLEPNPADRISAAETLGHPFFDSVRGRCAKNAAGPSQGHPPTTKPQESLSKEALAQNTVVGEISNPQHPQPCSQEIVDDTPSRARELVRKRRSLRAGLNDHARKENREPSTFRADLSRGAAQDNAGRTTGRLSEGHGEAPVPVSTSKKGRERRRTAASSTPAGRKRRCVVSSREASARNEDSPTLPQMITRSQRKAVAAAQSPCQQSKRNRQRMRHFR